MDQWHISIAGQQRGPYDQATLQDWYEQGRLPAETLVWADHLEGWRSIVEEFGPGPKQPDLQPPPPPPRGAGPGLAPPPTNWQRPETPGVAAPMRGGWVARPPTTGHAAVSAPLASLGRRLGAVLLDVVIIWVAYFAVGIVGLLLTSILGESVGGILAGLLFIGAFLTLIAWPIAGLGRLGQTYGKHLLGLRVVSSSTGQPIGVGSAIARNLVQGVGLYVIGLGWLWALWDEQQQGWHDKVVSSIVVDAPAGPRLDPLNHLRASFRGHA